MKKIKNIGKFTCIALVGFVVLFSSCKEEDDLVMPRLFRPVNFNVELNKTEATFSWAQVDSAVSYNLKVSMDSLNFDAPVLDTTITALTYKQEFAGKTTFYARIKANASDTTKNSKLNQIRFVTPAENLFEGFNSAMVGWKSALVKWRPAANVTALKLIADDLSSQLINLTAGQIAAGEIQLDALANSNYKVEIYKGDILRGTSKVLVEGDVYIEAGQDVIAAITNATDGQVIVLAPGVVFPTGGGTYRFTKSVKIKGANPISLSVVCMTSGTPTPSSNIFGFADLSTIGFVKFENIDFTGYCDNNPLATKVGYLFNNNLKTTVSNLGFANCKMRNFGNSPMRLQANKLQVIDTLRMTKCTVNDIGFSSTYGIINVNSSDFINNIYLNNCSFYNFKGSLILRTITSPATAVMGTINISNCNINKGMQDAGIARYLLDLNNTTINGGVTVRNSIFGATGDAKGANGYRKLPDIIMTVSGNYFTTDYVDDPIPIGTTSTSLKSLLTPYAGASTALWMDPVAGDFIIKATNFSGKGLAGDLRWY